MTASERFYTSSGSGTSASPREERARFVIAESTPLPGSQHVSRVAVSRSQAYYFKHAWQEGERESLADLARGESRVFEDARDAVRWLLEPDS